MRVEAFLISWNEIETIHLAVNHYQKFCSNIVIYDNHSTDRSDLVAHRMGCEVRKFGIPGVLDDKEYLKIKNFCWKGSKADWVIVCDADEMLLFENLKGNIMSTQGYNIYSHDMPKEDFLEIRTGVKDDSYSKLVCFSPEIKEINYVYGCHVANPVGNLEYTSEVPLLHYRCIGGPDRLLARHRVYRKRMSALNRRLGLGVHYLYDDQRRKTEWLESYEKCIELSLPGGWSSKEFNTRKD